MNNHRVNEVKTKLFDGFVDKKIKFLYSEPSHNVIIKENNGLLAVVVGFINTLDGVRLTHDEIFGLILKHGTKCLDYFDGNFALLVSDATRRSVWAASDPKASVSLYYSVGQQSIFFSTEIYLLARETSCSIDKIGIYSYLLSGYPWNERTLFENIKFLTPGSYIIFDKNEEIRKKNYFSVKEIKTSEGFSSEEEFINELDNSLKNIYAIHKKILVPLSGGVDSRLIALRLFHLNIPFDVVTYNGHVVEGDDYDVASRICQQLGIKHVHWNWNTKGFSTNVKELIYTSGGMCDAYTTYPDGMTFFHQLASGYDCALRGDEIFGWGFTSLSWQHAQGVLHLNSFDKLDRITKGDFKFFDDVKEIYVELQKPQNEFIRLGFDKWKQDFYWHTRVPRFIMPLLRWQSKFCEINTPFLTRNFQARMMNTNTLHRNNKKIARKSLTMVSEKLGLKNVPLAKTTSWFGGEPLMSLSKEYHEEMKRVILFPSPLDEFINPLSIISEFENYYQKAFSTNRIFHSNKSNIKNIINSTGLLGSNLFYLMFSPRTVRPDLIFKRVYSVKLFLNYLNP